MQTANPWMGKLRLLKTKQSLPGRPMSDAVENSTGSIADPVGRQHRTAATDFSKTAERRRTAIALVPRTSGDDQQQRANDNTNRKTTAGAGNGAHCFMRASMSLAEPLGIAERVTHGSEDFP